MLPVTIARLASKRLEGLAHARQPQTTDLGADQLRRDGQVRAHSCTSQQGVVLLDVAGDDLDVLEGDGHFWDGEIARRRRGSQRE